MFLGFLQSCLPSGRAPMAFVVPGLKRGLPFKQLAAVCHASTSLQDLQRADAALRALQSMKASREPATGLTNPLPPPPKPPLPQQHTLPPNAGPAATAAYSAGVARGLLCTTQRYILSDATRDSSTSVGAADDNSVKDGRDDSAHRANTGDTSDRSSRNSSNDSDDGVDHHARDHIPNGNQDGPTDTSSDGNATDGSGDEQRFQGTHSQPAVSFKLA